MMTSTSFFVDFLNHGTLPFVGREVERDRIRSFWRGTADAHGLRVMLALGEAGSGKSRLLDETFPAIIEAGGMVVHVRLRPEGAVSIAPLLAQGLRRSEVGRRIQRQGPQENLPSVIAHLRRLCGLRRTLLVIEDIHLLEGATLREFALLTEALADEPLALLAAARPVELAARGVLECYPTEEIRIGSLSREDLERLWTLMFGDAPEPATAAAILQSTRGNALALRSVLRGAINAGAIVADTGGGRWRVGVSPGAFAELADRNARQLSLGMASHLTEEERQAAEIFASLGEVFAREAAALISPGSDALIDALLFRGVLVRSTTGATSVNGIRSDGMLLAFTHTLTHKIFVESGPRDISRLAATVIARVPLYSILPFQLIAASAGAYSGDTTEIGAVIEQAYNITRYLNPTPDWGLLLDVWRAAERLVESHAGSIEPEQLREFRIRLIHLQIFLVNRGRNLEPRSIDVVTEAAARLMELTEEPLPDHLRTSRLHALAYAYDVHVARTQRPSRELWEQAEALIELRPSLMASSGYLNFLSFVANSMELVRKQDHLPILRQVEARYLMMIDRADVGEQFLYDARTKIGAHLLQLYESADEAAERKRQAMQLREIASPGDWLAHFRVIELHVQTFDIPFIYPIVDAAGESMRKLGVMTSYFICRRFRLVLDAARGESKERIAAEARELVEICAYSFRATFTVGLTAELLTVALLRNDRRWQQEILEEYGESIRTPLTPFCELLMLGIAGDGLAWAYELAKTAHADPPDWLYRSGRHDESLLRLAAAALGEGGAEEAAEAIAVGVAILRRPVLIYYDILIARGVSMLIERIVSQWPMRADPELSGAIASAAEASLAWLHERGAVSYMLPLIDAYGGYIAFSRAGEWRRKAMEMTGKPSPDPRPERKVEQRLRVTMIGTVQIARPGEEPQRLRGARHQALLGLLVAQATLAKPLRRAEFLALASGEYEDPEKARQWTNKAVLRLREVIGAEAIITGGETPELNPELLSVDLIEAVTLMRSAEDAVRRRDLTTARESLIAMLDITRGDVLYPTLYDQFFESAREEFESRARALIVETARRLLVEEDIVGAEELLSAAFNWMQGDEEIAGLFEEALRCAGKPTDAVRVGLAGVGS